MRINFIIDVIVSVDLIGHIRNLVFMLIIMGNQSPHYYRSTSEGTN